MKTRSIISCLVVTTLVLSLFPILLGAREREFAGETIHVAMVAEPREEVLKELTTEFEKKTGIRVVIDLLGNVDMKPKMLTTLQAKSSEYDIVQFDYSLLPFAVKSGWLYDLTDWVRRDATEVWPDDFHHVLYFTHIKYRDKWYAMPMHVNSQAFFYRTDIFDEMGFDAPKNWDDTILKAKAINEKYAPDVYGITLMGAPGPQLALEFESWLVSQGVDYYDRMTYEPLIDTPAGEKAMDILQNLVKYAPPGVASYSVDGNYSAFAQGKGAMCIAWSTGVFFFGDPEHSKIVDKWEVMAMPGGYTVLGGWFLAISEFAKQKGAAWEWLKWATSVDMERRLLGNMECPRLSILLDPEVQKKWPNNRVFYEALEKSPTLMPRVKFIVEIWTKIGIGCNEVITGITKPKDALKRMHEEMGGMLERAGYLQR